MREPADLASTRRAPLTREVIFFIALLATTLSVSGGLAHLFELPNKMGFSRDEYFITQQAYRGWNLFAIVLLVQLLSLVTLAVMARTDRCVFWAAIVAIVCLLTAQALFWTYTYPANAATRNWTSIPEGWERLRREWEYSHAAGAIAQLAGLIALFVGALARRRTPS